MNTIDSKLLEQVKRITNGSRKVIEQDDLTKAAVLVSIIYRGDNPHFILTKRTMTVATHKGQISFPGGAREPEDPTEVENALREAEEEVGLDPKRVQVAGMLDDFVTGSGFLVTPVIGFVDANATFKVDPVEVDELFEVPFEVFLNSDNHEYQEGVFSFHRYRFKDYDIWGATAGIIYRFFEALEEANPGWS